jgi:hypothetical protein
MTIVCLCEVFQVGLCTAAGGRVDNFVADSKVGTTKMRWFSMGGMCAL